MEIYNWSITYYAAGDESFVFMTKQSTRPFKFEAACNAALEAELILMKSFGWKIEDSHTNKVSVII